MAGEIIRDYAASWVDLEANGASIANNAFAEANDAQYSMATDGGGRLHLELEIEVTFGTAPTANTQLIIYAQDLDLFGGTDDAIAPSANNSQLRVAVLSVSNVTTAQRRRLDILDAPRHAAYWLQNAATGQTISAGWKLRARAWSEKVA
jgi:hypothetical protein